MIGESIGQYRIEKKLGEGGVGEVYRALDTVLERAVALKRLRPELARRADVVERFRSEARTLAQLNHANIATIHAFDHDGDQWFIVMEYVGGETVSEMLRRRGRLDLSEALPIFLQALDGLGYAHDRGIVHRDIKGSNLIVMPGGFVKIMDFGIARVLGAERLTQFGHPVGTPEYMAPEQIRGDEIDARADIYALGSLFYAMLCGEPPFSGRSDYELMRAQIETEPPPLGDRVPGLPEPVVRAIERALAKNPLERFSSTGEFREALAPCIELEGDEATDDAATAQAGATDRPVRELTRVLPDREAEGARIVAPEPPAPVPEASDTRTLAGQELPGRRPWRAALVVVAAALALAAGINLLRTRGPVLEALPLELLAPAVATEPLPAPVASPETLFAESETTVAVPEPEPVPVAETAASAAALESAAVAAPQAPPSAPAPPPRTAKKKAKAQPRRASADEKKTAAKSPAGQTERRPASPRQEEASPRLEADSGPGRGFEGWVIRRQ